MAVDFGIKLGFSSNALIQALLLVQFVSFPSALLFGRLGDRIGTRRAIYLGLGVFVALTCFAYFMQNERQFYILAAVVGTVQGGVQALSRSYFARLIPRERAGEYFGFYNMLAKFAAVLGPLAMGVVAIATGNQRLSILVLEVFFIGAGAGARAGRSALVSLRGAAAAARHAETAPVALRWRPARSAVERSGAPARPAWPKVPGGRDRRVRRNPSGIRTRRAVPQGAAIFAPARASCGSGRPRRQVARADAIPRRSRPTRCQRRPPTAAPALPGRGS